MLTLKLQLWPLLLLLLLLPCWHVASAVQRNERDGCWQHREHVVERVCLTVYLSACLPVTACGRWVWQVLYVFLYIERGVRSIDKIASNYTVRAGFGIGFSLRCWRCWRFCQLANCFFVFALVSPPPYFHSPPTLMFQRRGKAGGAGTLA